MNQSEFATKLFTLSSIAHVYDPNPLQPRIEDHVMGKHIELLNAIALLLISRAQGDIAAVAIDHHPPYDTSVELIWAKNSPATPAELDYIEKLAEIVRNHEDVNDKVMILKTLIQHTVPFCIAKLRHRVKKLAFAIAHLPQGSTFLPLTQSATVQKTLQETHEVGNASFTSALESLSTWACNMRTKSALEFLGEKNWDKKLYYANVLGLAAESDTNAYTLLSPEEGTVIRRIRRIGDYFLACRLLARVATATAHQHYRRRFHTKQAAVPTPVHISVPGDFIQNINVYIQKRTPGQRPLTYQDLCLLDPNLENPAGVGPKMLTESTHAELSIASHFIKKQSKGMIPIGVSKRACFLCHKYFCSLPQDEGLKFFVSGYHRKIPATWRAPQADANPEMMAAEVSVGTMINTALDTTIARILRKRKSDSAELEHPDIDAEERKIFHTTFGGNVFDDE